MLKQLSIRTAPPCRLYGYDAMNRKTNEVYVGVTTNQFAYDGASDLLTLTDGKNQTTTWDYDSFGRVTNKVDGQIETRSQS